MPIGVGGRDNETSWEMGDLEEDLCDPLGMRSEGNERHRAGDETWGDWI